VTGRGGVWHKPWKDRDCHSLRSPVVSMQFERILSDLIADVQHIEADDTSWPKDDVPRIAMAPYNNPLQPILASGQRPPRSVG